MPKTEHEQVIQKFINSNTAATLVLLEEGRHRQYFARMLKRAVKIMEVNILVIYDIKKDKIYLINRDLTPPI